MIASQNEPSLHSRDEVSREHSPYDAYRMSFSLEMQILKDENLTSESVTVPNELTGN